MKKNKSNERKNETGPTFLLLPFLFLLMRDCKFRGRAAEEEKQKETRKKVGYRHKRMQHRFEAHPQPN